ncbi:type II toxin-antitoxin system RelE/ParE family toxin [Erwinia sorbitola]|uniref:Type II toxin-antitoxin system mRNA interferase toxin, RelE/StbE family n=1 Tax=Erwinia sorbitola TaxID=2681984 RepID=A0A6I6ER70_9GAMM|nr:type II toxin-antitoxin system RelE/ParE family toxin [Erwinia sorbitola]MTD29007.1 type II toxin-antitoxin system mRNA interferase toxin, RelE/StbE family [Erwinia sorbitola]QGU89251.1 type II toxin-antitoxin system mRNA interferase toxin, RelE/StbE family [Erwinia sorbitola]
MTQTIRWERQAQADREAIFRYLYQEAGLSVASATDDKFVSMTGILKENPLAGTKAGRTARHRKLVVPRFPFIIIYVVEGKVVSILRVLHTARKIAGRYQKS